MKREYLSRRRKDIKNVLTVLGSAMLCAALLSILFLYYYGPSGRYFAGSTILDPKVIKEINFQERHPNTGRIVHFIFDHMEFSYYDFQLNKMQQKQISLESYEAFYNLVYSEKSLENVSNQIKDLFLKSNQTLLTTTMRTEEANKIATKIFQVIQFVSDDYFRVKLHEEQNQEEWAYFYYPGLYRKVMQMFTKSSNL